MNPRQPYINNVDIIDNLPTDRDLPSHQEIQILDSLFKEKYDTMTKILSGTKDVIIIGLVFLIFNLPQIDEIIKKFFPASVNSVYILVGIRVFLFMLCYFIIKNLYLVKK
jgi:hypothetical protein